MWINPFATVKMVGEDSREKALAFFKDFINFLCAEVQNGVFILNIF